MSDLELGGDFNLHLFCVEDSCPRAQIGNPVTNLFSPAIGFLREADVGGRGTSCSEIKLKRQQIGELLKFRFYEAENIG